jgi:hypothetical protein
VSSAAVLLGLVLNADLAEAGAVAPHRALYAMSLESAHGSSGLVGASGTLAYKWADTCDGWTIEQNYHLSMQYQDEQPVAIESNFVTWESMDGKSYRFHQRESRNGEVSDEIGGNALLGAHGGGTAKFDKPKAHRFALPPGSLFPTAHTLTLIHEGEIGQRFFLAHVFDGSTVDGTSTISAVIAPTTAPRPDLAGTGIDSPLLRRPSWQMWLAFFSDATQDTQPDYALGMRLLDNGVSSEMTIDYGDYVLKATLTRIEALPKPVC